MRSIHELPKSSPEGGTAEKAGRHLEVCDKELPDDPKWEADVESRPASARAAAPPGGPGPLPAPSSFDLGKEARLLADIAVPTVAVQFSIFFLFPQTASSLGRTLGTEELAGFSLASLTGNITCLSVIIGALSASETLQPRAYGSGDYAEVGRLAVRGAVASALALIPPLVPLLFYLDGILTGPLGQDPVASDLASRWVRVYLLGLPSVVLFRTAQRFLACQGVVWPMAYAGALGCFVVHPLLLRWLVPAAGFLGSGAAVVTTQTVQAAGIMLYLRWARPQRPETWPGLTLEFWRESIRPGPMLRFLRLGMGGVLSFSEWWFWETMCFVAGRFGVVPLCVHTIAYQLVPMLFMIPLGVSVGMSVRIGTVLATDVDRAKRIARWTMVFTTVLASLAAALVYSFRVPIVALFTTDEDVMRGCERIWGKVCIFVVILFVFGINSGIMRALGLQWRMATIVFSGTWCLTLPAVVHLAVRRGGGVDAMWSVLPCGYAAMNVAFFAVMRGEDWRAVGEGGARRGGLGTGGSARKEVPGEGTPLLGGGRRRSRSGDHCI